MWFLDGIERLHPEQLFLERADGAPHMQPLPSGARMIAGRGLIPRNSISCWN